MVRSAKAALLTFTCSIAMASVESRQESQNLDLAPHIVVMIADDLGLDAAPCHNPHHLMPKLEARCETSLVFTHAYAHPYCTASRASILTGRHTFRHGANDVRQSSKKLPLREVTLPEFIRSNSAAPYQFAAFGKWHLADDHNGSIDNPNLQGFDHFEGTPRQHHTYRYTDYEWVINGVSKGKQSTYKTTKIVDAALAYMAGNGEDKPRVLFLNFVNPHRPYHLPPKHLHNEPNLIDPGLKPTRSDNPKTNEFRVNEREARFDPMYRAMLGALDTEIDRFTSTVTNLTSRPLIFIFLGDNGSAAEVYLTENPAGYRAKASIYDGGVRVPLQIWSNDNQVLPVNETRTNRLVHLTDLFATIAEITGVSPSNAPADDSPNQIDAQSFADGIFSNKRTISGERKTKSFAHREYLYLERGNARQPFAFGIVHVSGDKLILRDLDRTSRYAGEVKMEYYETATDPGESKNLFNNCRANFARAHVMLDELAKLHAEAGEHSNFESEKYKTLLVESRLNCTKETR